MRVESGHHFPGSSFTVKNPQLCEVFLDGRKILSPVVMADDTLGEVEYLEAGWKHGGPLFDSNGHAVTVKRQGKVEIKGEFN